jgi:hypothetical protein
LIDNREKIRPMLKSRLTASVAMVVVAFFLRENGQGAPKGEAVH